MQVIRHQNAELANAELVGARSVVTIGNFDGVHLGHQALINRCRSHCQEGDLLTVVTFEPLPQAWFNPQQAALRLHRLSDKLRRLRELGVDLVWVMGFNQHLANTTAEEFVTERLVKVLNARHIVVGEDFRFGHQRTGDVAMLETMGESHGFSVEAHHAVMIDGQRVSSTGIRAALAQGDLDIASRMLGRPYSMRGRVIHGEHLGRTLGYPTANIAMREAFCPLQGIFAVRVRLAEEDRYLDGVANLGRRPTVGGRALLLEVHIFDYQGDLYGQKMHVEFISKLRNEEHFDSLDEMLIQMKNDERVARQRLADGAATGDPVITDG